MALYLILSGQFRDAQDVLRGAGDTVELPDDIAAEHAGKLQPVVASAPVPDQPSGKKPKAESV